MTHQSFNVDEWALLVGTAIVRFGEIELISLKCFAFFSPEDSALSVAKLNFVPRAEKLIKVLQAQECVTRDIQELISAFTLAIKLAKTRNLIAHNPVILDLYVNEDETEAAAERWIRSARTDLETLDLAGLKEFVDEVDDLAAELWMRFLRASDGANPMWRTHKL